MAEKEKTVKIRIRSASPGLAYAQGKWYEVSETEFKRLKAYRFWPRRLTDDERKKVAGTPLNIEEWDEKEHS